MVATRVSPTATLPKTQAVIADVVRSLGDLERLPTSKRLQQDLEALQQYIASDALHIEVVIAAPVSDPDRAARIAQWLAPGLSSDVLATAPDAPLVLSPTQNGGPAVRLEVYSAVRPRSRRAAEPRAAVLVCIADPLSAVDDQARDSVEALCEDRPYALLIADGHGGPVTPPNGLLRGAWYAECLDSATLAAPGLSERLRSAPWSGAMELSRTHAALCAARAATEAIRLLLEQEVREVRVRRAVAQQRSGQLQQAGTLNVAEVMNSIRALLQEYGADFERGIGDRLGRLFAPQDGTLGVAVEERLAALDDLATEDKSRTTVLTVPDDAKSEILDLVYQSVHAHCMSDLKALRDLLQLLKGELERLLEPVGAPPFIQLGAPGRDRLDRSLAMAVRFDKPYRAEIPRRGIGEFLAFVRRSVFMLLGLGSLLALVIGSGRMAAFKSSLEPWRAPLAVILGVAFVVYAYRSITGQRDETRLREVEKARDSIRAEVRRMVTEFERAWTSTLTDSLREQLAVAQRQADDALRAAQGRQASELADEKKRLQRQLQSLDATERQATTVAKSREVHAERIAALQGELRQTFGAMVAQLRGRPA